MPIQRCSLPNGKLGYKWGSKGKCYPSRAGAVRQAVAVYASGWREKVKKIIFHGKSLYVKRPVANAEEIVEWAKSVGFDTTLPPEDMHVTIVYSREPFDASKVPFDPYDLNIGRGEGKRTLTPLGDEGAIVLKFESDELQKRWREYRKAGASWDYDSYQPHITITYKAPEGMDLSKIQPYMGPIKLWPEESNELETDWGKKRTEKEDISQQDLDTAGRVNPEQTKPKKKRSFREIFDVVVRKENPYRDDKGRYTTKDKAMEIDMAKQVQWLEGKAKENQAGTLEELVSKHPTLFAQLAEMWRKARPHFSTVRGNVLKGNPYHDEEGKFTTAENAVVRSDASGINYDLIDSLTRPGHAYRGMTSEEFDATVGAGKGVQSRRDYSHESEGTSFGKDFATSESYANYGRDDPRKTGKPTYLVEVLQDQRLQVDPRDDYLKAKDEIPRNNITRVFQFSASDDKKNILMRDITERMQGAVQKAERVLKPFVSFQQKINTKAKGNLQMIASLHTSRLSAYGFTAEANALGVTEYAVSEQLDTRICPVCATMHGKKFAVGDARRLLNTTLRVKNPDDLRTLQPWPKQDKQSVEILRSMSAPDIVARNWHVPPYHPRCRGLLVHVDQVPRIEDTPSFRAAFGIVEEKTPVSEEQVLETMQAMGLGQNKKTAEVFAKTFNATPDEVAKKLFGTTDTESIEFKPDGNKGLAFESGGKIFGSQYKVTYDAILRPEQNSYLEFLKINEKDAGVGMKAVKALVEMAQSIGSTGLSLFADIKVGSYAWAKYGFVPESAEVWQDLRGRIKKNYDTWVKGKVSAVTTGVIEKALASDDPYTVWVLSDLSEMVGGEKVGKKLLVGISTAWDGKLDFTDSQAMERFKQYVGRYA